MKARGVGEWTSVPPLTRLLWALGVDARPPTFQGMGTLALGYGGVFGPLWGFTMHFRVWRNEERSSVLEGIVTSIFAGVLFGLTMA